MAQELLSKDPAAGQMLSSDPNAAQSPSAPTPQATQSGLASWLHLNPQASAAIQEIAAHQAKESRDYENWPADVASHLPEPLRKPLGIILGLIKPAVEIYGVTRAAPLAMRAGQAVDEAIAGPGGDAVLDQTKAVGKQVAKKIGIDPDAMEMQTARNELAATKMRLDAARSRLRQQAITTKTASDAAWAQGGKELQTTPIEEDVRAVKVLINSGLSQGQAITRAAEGSGARVGRLYNYFAKGGQ